MTRTACRAALVAGKSMVFLHALGGEDPPAPRPQRRGPLGEQGTANPEQVASRMREGEAVCVLWFSYNIAVEST